MRKQDVEQQRKQDVEQQRKRREDVERREAMEELDRKEKQRKQDVEQQRKEDVELQRKRRREDCEEESRKRQEKDELRMETIIREIQKRARDQSLVDMEARMTAKLNAGKEMGDFAAKLFDGVTAITQSAVTALGNAATSRVYVATSEAVTNNPTTPQVPVKHLRGKALANWTTEDVQHWLDAKNLHDLLAGAIKHSLDGHGLLLMKEPSVGDTYVEELWPTAFKLHKALFKQALKELP